jgi:hypothetical protein
MLWVQGRTVITNSFSSSCIPYYSISLWCSFRSLAFTCTMCPIGQKMCGIMKHFLNKTSEEGERTKQVNGIYIPQCSVNFTTSFTVIYFRCKSNSIGSIWSTSVSILLSRPGYTSSIANDVRVCTVQKVCLRCGRSGSQDSTSKYS